MIPRGISVTRAVAFTNRSFGVPLPLGVSSMIIRRKPDAFIRLVYVLGLVLAFASPGNGLNDSFLPVARLRISARRLSCVDLPNPFVYFVGTLHRPVMV